MASIKQRIVTLKGWLASIEATKKKKVNHNIKIKSKS
tara:strand:- start:77 stop:187 length:111 start_codon:yes stop_codon:yes gene_type:complete